MDIKYGWLDAWIEKNRWMVKEKDNKYENKIDGWLDDKKKKHMKKIDVQKNRRMVGWI